MKLSLSNKLQALYPRPQRELHPARHRYTAAAVAALCSSPSVPACDEGRDALRRHSLRGAGALVSRSTFSFLCILCVCDVG